MILDTALSVLTYFPAESTDRHFKIVCLLSNETGDAWIAPPLRRHLFPLKPPCEALALLVSGSHPAPAAVHSADDVQGDG